MKLNRKTVLPGREDRLKWLKQNAAQAGILLLIAAVLLGFSLQKQGFHMDELLSFELANAEFNPWIVPTQPVGRLAKLYHSELEGATPAETLGNVTGVIRDFLQNGESSLLAGYQADVYEEPVWIGREQFRDYIQVKKGDAFNYLSVYFNVKDDNHPPLHFMVLHTISSVFQGRTAPLMGCVINIAAVLGCCILMMRLGRIRGRKGAGMAAALLYGLSCGAIATTLLIRMYGMMTFFCVAFFYLNAEKYRKKEFTCRNKWLIAVTVLGFWTQYFFLFYCIGLFLVVAVLLIKQGERKALVCYIRSMVIAAFIGLLGFPFAVSDVFSSQRGTEALENLSNGLSGYGARLLAFLEILINRMFGSPVLLVLLLAACALGYVLTRGRSRVKEEAACFAMLFIPPVLYFLLAARMSPYLVDRYIMAVFPFAMMLCAALITGLGSRRFTVLCTAVICIFNIVSYDGEYLYKGYEDQRALAESYAELPCICIYDGSGYYENLIEFTDYAETLLTTLEELSQRQEQESIRQKDEIVVLIKHNVDAQKALSVLEQKYGLKQQEILMDGNGVYGDFIILCTRG